MDSPSVPEGLRLAHEQAQLSCGNLSKISYYIGRETIVPTERIPGMAHADRAIQTVAAVLGGLHHHYCRI
jgi:hypothetical protein